MWIDRLTSSGTTRALELSAQFAAQRQRVLAENLANVDVPNYQTQRLDPGEFESALKKALDRTGGRDTAALELRGSAQVAAAPDGTLVTQPVRAPADNVLFHDGTNSAVERLMTDINQNSLAFDLSTTLLKGKYDSLLRAVRGRTG